jgi:hypothetical protein
MYRYSAFFLDRWSTPLSFSLTHLLFALYLSLSLSLSLSALPDVFSSLLFFKSDEGI